MYSNNNIEVILNYFLIVYKFASVFSDFQVNKVLTDSSKFKLIFSK